MTEEQELALALQMSMQGAGMSGLMEEVMETGDRGTVQVDSSEVYTHPLISLAEFECRCLFPVQKTDSGAKETDDKKGNHVVGVVLVRN